MSERERLEREGWLAAKRDVEVLRAEPGALERLSTALAEEFPCSDDPWGMGYVKGMEEAARG